MMLRAFRRVALAVCALLPLGASAAGISGAIGDTTWTAENSPYRVAGQCTVYAWETLIIEPGVDVLFDADAEIVINGTLHARGTETDSVRFLPGEAAQWGGIRIFSEDSSSLTYTRISGGNAEVGGGLCCAGQPARVTLAHCVITGNAASSGGGVFADSGVKVWLSRCDVSRNTTTSYGAGIYNEDGTMVVQDCLVSGNAAGGSGGGVVNGSTISLTGCTIIENTSGRYGGGFDNWDVSSLVDCIIADNSAASDGGGIENTDSLAAVGCTITGNHSGRYGGGIDNWAGRTSLTRCLFADNSATYDGGGIFNYVSATLAVTNCTIADNTTASQGGGFYNASSAQGRLVNTIISGNSPQNMYYVDGAVEVAYSCIPGGIPEGVAGGNGNISDDPLFFDPQSGDYSLLSVSPCVDAGDPESPLDADGTRADMGALSVLQNAAYLAFAADSVLPGDTVTVAVLATVDTCSAVRLAFAANQGHVQSIELVASAFDGLTNSRTGLKRSGDTVYVNLTCDEIVTLDSEVIASLRFTMAPATAAIESTPLTWLRDSTEVDELPIVCTNGAIALKTLYGDVTRNGWITAEDASYVLQSVVRLRRDIGKRHADVTGNGYISATDAALIVNKVVNPRYVFPIQGGSGLARSAWDVARTLDLVESGTGWTLVISDAEGVNSGDVTIAIPGDCDVTVSGGTMSAANRVDGDILVAFVRDLSDDPALVYIEPREFTGALPTPRIVRAELNEGAIAVDLAGPRELTLDAAVPNPFNPQTTIRFALPAAGVGTLVVYDMLGRPVRTLMAGRAEAGEYALTWDGRDNTGRAAASGVYIYRLRTESGTLARRMTLVR